MITKLLSTLIAMLSLTSAQAEPINYAQTYSHDSSILNEPRQYSVYLPEEYHLHPGQRFPVLYLLDGEQHLLEVAGITRSLRGGLTPSIPPVIIVAVHNTDRMRDYTPTHTEHLPNGQPAGPAYANTGGAPDFLRYLTRELRDDIEQKFRTIRPALLIGHSLGGLLALESVAKNNDDFQGIISIDASLWFDFPRNTERLQQAFNQPRQHPASLFIAIANNPYTPGFGYSTFHRDHLLQFAGNIASKAHNIDMTKRYYADEDHHSVYHLAVYQGLQWLFRGYRIDLSPDTFSFNQVKARYQALNQRLNSQLKPEQSRLTAIERKARGWPQMQIPSQQVSAILNYYFPSSAKSQDQD